MPAAKQVVEKLWDNAVLDVDLPSVPDVEKLNVSLGRSGVVMQIHAQRTRQENNRRTEEIAQTAEMVASR